MSSAVKPIPAGFHAITPHLVVQGASAAIEFYKQAFSAEELDRSPTPDGRLIHATLQIGDSKLMLVDEFPEMGGKSPQTLGGSPVSFHLYVEDVDAVFNQAIAAGGRVKMPVGDMFWGDRFGVLTDPFGHEWSVATHKEDVSPEEIAQRAKAAFGAKPDGACAEAAVAEPAVV
jgi:PhnB protein